MDEKMIQRINELYHKSKAEGLNEAEKKEQALLREQYLAAIRKNIRAQMENVDFVNPDGSITPASEVRKQNLKKKNGK